MGPFDRISPHFKVVVICCVTGKIVLLDEAIRYRYQYQVPTQRIKLLFIEALEYKIVLQVGLFVVLGLR